MSSTRTWILSAALSTGIFSLLPIEAAHAQESFQFDITLESTTVDPGTGEVTISGTVTCSEPADAYFSVYVTQSIGREKGVEAATYYNGPISCDQDGEPYSLSLFANEGRFAPGRAVVTQEGYACSWYTCSSYVRTQQSVRLSPGPRH